MKIHFFTKAYAALGIILLFFIKIGLSQYSGGDGSAMNPYQLSTKSDIISLSNKINNWNACFVLTADIDMNPTNVDPTTLDWDGDSIADVNGFLPIGFTSNPFVGNFDGQNYSISNIYINQASSSYVGFFGYVADQYNGVDYNVEISNFNLRNVEIYGYSYVGALAGHTIAQNNGLGSITISNISTSGSILGDEVVTGMTSFNKGGLIGVSYFTTIESSYSSCFVLGSYYLGGLVGWNYNSVINNSYAKGACSGDYNNGGLVGWVNNGISEHNYCYATGNTNYGSDGEATDCGGLVGYYSDDVSLLSTCVYDYSSTGSEMVGLGDLTTANTTQSTSVPYLYTEDFNDQQNFNSWVFVSNPNSSTPWRLFSSAYSRPFLYWQTSSISNGTVDILSSSSFNVTAHYYGDIKEYGVRYMSFNAKNNAWQYERNLQIQTGSTFSLDVNLNTNDKYYVQPYIIDVNDNIEYGDMVLLDSDQSNSISENNEIEFTLYPNPCVNSVNIKLDSYTNYQIEVVSINGQVLESLYSDYLANVNINTSNYSKGTYLLLLKDGNNISSKTFIVN